MSRVSLAVRRAARRPDRSARPAQGRAGAHRSNPFESLQRTAGNHVVGDLLRHWAGPGDRALATPEQPRPTVRGEESELEADANRAFEVRGQAAGRGPARDRGAADAPLGREGMPERGDSLPSTIRRDFESRLGIDLADVRVHHDGQAARGADSVDSRAFTIGRDVFFAGGEYAPGTAAGRRLLGHELTHVAQQQQSGPALQRQARSTIGPKIPQVPQDLQQSIDVSKLSDDALVDRHDRILDVLAQFTESTPETDALANEAAYIGTELARRRALAAGRTFSGDAIDTIRAYFEANAKKPHRPAPGSTTPAPAGGWQDSCIVALNHGMRLATGESTLPTTPKTIEKSMEKVEGAGFAGSAREVWFQQKSGKISRGGARPERLDKSVWDALIDLSGGDPGWSVFTMSVLDGNHSVTLTLDNNDPKAPKVFWSDQWASKGGWKQYTRATLDAELTKLVQGWWDEQAEGKKFPPVIRLWRMRSTKAPSGRP